ncbi:MAG: bacillithiol system redox-active protein YtxJ [Saprospiraceae bacterium]|nr:bacillithiol system redox-active protein YtxJ [Saprospiraceae bacterium]
MSTTQKSWIALQEPKQLKEIIDRSFQQPVLIFKHSTSCGISHAAHHHLEKNTPKLAEVVEFYYLDLLRFRNISNQIAQDFNVIHQSPQILVLKNGKVSFHTSHHAIDAEQVIKQFT